MYTRYNSNNSGGWWWLKDHHWYALEAAGWKVGWVWLREDYDAPLGEDGLPVLVPEEGMQEGERWLGGLAREAYRAGLGEDEAREEWESITQMDSYDSGCACCGPPHNFYERGDE